MILKEYTLEDWHFKALCPFMIKLCTLPRFHHNSPRQDTILCNRTGIVVHAQDCQGHHIQASSIQFQHPSSHCRVSMYICTQMRLQLIYEIVWFLKYYRVNEFKITTIRHTIQCYNFFDRINIGYFNPTDFKTCPSKTQRCSISDF